MPTLPITQETLQLAIDEVTRRRTVKAAAEALGLARTTLSTRVQIARAAGMQPSPGVVPIVPELRCPFAVPDEKLRRTLEALQAHGGNQTAAAEALQISRATLQRRLIVARERGITADAPPAEPVTLARKPPDPALLRSHLLARPRLAGDVMRTFGISRAVLDDLLEGMATEGYAVTRRDDQVAIERRPPPIQPSDELHTFRSDERGYYRFGVISDTHYGSKYAREDVCEDIYDWFAAEGVSRVYLPGNYIDGEFRFNRFELLDGCHGMTKQVDYFARRFPRRPGIDTYFVAGDDHEGWYAQSTGVDIGRYTERHAREELGRHDLRYLGYMEAFITLLHAAHGTSTQLLVAHPGGGSAYAISYAAQKFVEALQGGEKPAVILFGHWHKIFDLLIRNVICLGAGCTKDLDSFGRKKKLAYHVGGLIVELWQDAKGAIVRYRTEKKQYFDRGYHNEQWSHSGPINRPHVTR